MFASADGVVDDPTGEQGTAHGGWSMPSLATPGVVEALTKQAAEADVAVFGRRTYGFFAERWPQRTGALADRLNAMPKRVVTSSPLPQPLWGDAAVVGVDDLTGLDGEAVVYGSLGLGRELLRRGVVDELRLLVCPVLLGAGARLTDGTGGREALQLLQVRDVGSDVALLRFAVRGS